MRGSADKEETLIVAGESSVRVRATAVDGNVRTGFRNR